MKLDSKTEGTLAVLAALLVLFSSMLDPRVSVILAAGALLGFGVLRFAQKS